MTRSPSKLGRLATAGALAMILVAMGSAAEARERAAGARAGAAAGALQPRRAAAGNWTRTTETQRTATGYTRNSTVTNGKGETATRDVSVNRDRQAGTSTRSVDYTGFDGRSTSVDSTRTRTADGMTLERNVTTPNGRTIEHDVVKSCDKAAGKCTTTVTHEVTPPPAAP